MARIVFQVLGAPGRDNALLAAVQTGQAIQRLLFDCGEECVAPQPVAESQAIDQILFSHLHMDHIAGFDSLFRRIFNRTARPNLVWGPPGTAAIIHHRLRGFMWNLADRLESSWLVHDIYPERVERVRYQAREAFAVAHPEPALPRGGPLIAHPDYSVDALTLDHGTPSIGYVVRAAARLNVDPQRLQALGLAPGAWIEHVKYPQPGAGDDIVVDGRAYRVSELRQRLLVVTPGESLAYMTDFHLDPSDAPGWRRAVELLRGCTTLVCESQYREADADLARRNMHMTSVLSARLAADAQVGRLVLCHLSERYTQAERLALRDEARALFARADLPDGWDTV
jgi:ribonuclease Z